MDKICSNWNTIKRYFRGRILYHTDKYGGVYKVRASNGEVVWRTEIPNVTLINNSLTIDDKHIYIPVRKP